MLDSETQQELAERLARESINRWGFVVVSYNEGMEPKIGERETYLWCRFEMPQPFVVAREATPAEVQAQLRLFHEITGQKNHPEAFTGKCFALVTD